MRHVINLALDDHPEALRNEAELLGANRIGYTHIPVPFDSPKYDHVEALRIALDAADGPVHIHCIMNFRVTAFLYLLDLAAGVSEQEARRAMQVIWDPIASDDPRAKPWRGLLLGTAD